MTDEGNWEQQHYDLLQAVRELQGDRWGEYHPPTSVVGDRLLEIYKTHPPYSWQAFAPWHATSPMAQELEQAGLMEIGVGMASISAPGQPAAIAKDYFLSLTPAGREFIDEHLQSSSTTGRRGQGGGHRASTRYAR